MDAAKRCELLDGAVRATCRGPLHLQLIAARLIKISTAVVQRAAVPSGAEAHHKV